MKLKKHISCFIYRRRRYIYTVQHLTACRLRYLSRYDSLRAGRSRDRIPMGGEIFRTRPDRLWGPPRLLYNGYRISFQRVKRPGHGVDHPFPSSTEVKETLELYLYSPLDLHGTLRGDLYLYFI
jgi:hypothetical protein